MAAPPTPQAIVQLVQLDRRARAAPNTLTSDDIPAALRAASIPFRVDTVPLLRGCYDNFRHQPLRAVIGCDESFLRFVEEFSSILHAERPRCFLVLYGTSVSCSAARRFTAFTAGAHMVTHVLDHLINVLGQLNRLATSSFHRWAGRAGFTCPLCGEDGFTELGLWDHMPLFHIHSDTHETHVCPLCSRTTHNIVRHIVEGHPPPEDVKRHSVTRMALHGEGEGWVPVSSHPATVSCFALVVVENPHTRQFLLVQEYGGNGYWLPGGHVEPGESLQAGAIRETKEEGGIDVELKGVLRVDVSQHCVSVEPSSHRRQRMRVTPGGQRADPDHTKVSMRLKVIFYAQPKDHTQQPKTFPDFESAGALWISEEELSGDVRLGRQSKIPLRGSEPSEWFRYVCEGGPIYPLDIVNELGEGRPASKPQKALVER
ncbi:unnamed protein product [Vitrella brassicaformis CCMP3155]|uniref:Nudix hydrolase domain-containing protein n=3 Tax=Vitrella brassicaformis TaxID=1169539 RepID=A0A0G4GZZ0_VITBC|nr:unnamed protein product [Vitrella brassicaformis CCMP3155]|eukprot:CEM36802.1 unnamed protein product [Vitrella brassicaformis CCMP3155]